MFGRGGWHTRLDSFRGLIFLRRGLRHPGHANAERPEDEQQAHEDVDHTEERVRALRVAGHPSAGARALVGILGPEGQAQPVDPEDDDERTHGEDEPDGETRHDHTTLTRPPTWLPRESSSIWRRRSSTRL